MSDNKHTKKKIGLLTLLGGAIAITGIKNVLFGKPRQQWRKNLFYGALAGMTFLKMCGDEVQTGYDKTKELFQTMSDEKIERIEKERDYLKHRYEQKLDSLEQRIEETDKRLSYQTILNNQYQARKVEPAPLESSIEKKVNQPYEGEDVKQDAESGKEVNWYGARSHETYEEIAKKYLGSEDKQDVLKSLNSHKSIDKDGEVILLPYDVKSMSEVNSSPIPKMTLADKRTRWKEIVLKHCLPAPSGRDEIIDEIERVRGYNQSLNNPREPDPVFRSYQKIYLPRGC